MREDNRYAARTATFGLALLMGVLAAWPGTGVIMAADGNGPEGSFLASLHTNSMVASTVPPANGDVNPYGVAVVPRTKGALVAGNILVSNFNNCVCQLDLAHFDALIWPPASLPLLRSIPVIS